MKKLFDKINKRKMFSFIAVICVATALRPAEVQAVTSYPPYAQHGSVVSYYETYDIDNQTLEVYMTDGAGYIQQSGSGNNLVFTAYDYDNGGYKFSHWETYYRGTIKQARNYSWDSGSEWCFSKAGAIGTEYNPEDRSIQVNNEWSATGVYYVVAVYDVKVNVSVKHNGVPVENPDSITIFSYCEYQDAHYYHEGRETGLQAYVCQNSDASVLSNYDPATEVVDYFRVNGTDIDSSNIYVSGNQMFFDFTPERVSIVDINFRYKIQNVSFDSNTGSGTMAQQSFDYGVEEELSENQFKKSGYAFDKWNTEPDGSGNSYADGQKLTFTPENDGDSITLYAQWKECTMHEVKNGVCEICGQDHTHSYIYSARGNTITQTCGNSCVHNETATLVQDAGVDTAYDGTAVKALKVVYSDGWDGGNLTIDYVGNINAGTAKGTISAGNKTAYAAFEITKVPLTVTAKDNTITYGQAPAGSGVTYTGFVNGETETVLGGTLRFDSTYTRYGDIGVYDIIPKGLTAQNYEITYSKGELSVVPKEIDITWGNTELVYDGSAKFPEFTADGIVAGDDVEFILSGEATDIGQGYLAEITGITGADAPNYKLPDGNLTVTFNIEERTEPVIPEEDDAVSDDSESADTGDSSYFYIWLSMILSGIGIVRIAAAQRRKA